MALPYMTKHKGIPSGLPGTGHQFTLRRANPKGASKLFAKRRYADRSKKDTLADTAFLHALWHKFADEPFERGNLDAGRIAWLWEREIVPAEDPFDLVSYEALICIDENIARKSFPDAFLDVLEI